jgi:methyl-accepting chemotaxis protein
MAGFIALAILVPGFSETSRDVAIVILAAFQFIAAVLTIALLLTLLYAIKAINDLTQRTIVPKVDMLTVKVDEIVDNTRTIVGDVRESTGTVSTTTSYAAERVVAPIIRVSGLVAGVRAAASSLAQRDVPTSDPAAANRSGE